MARRNRRSDDDLGNEACARVTFDAIAGSATPDADLEARFRTPWSASSAAAFLGDGIFAEVAGRRVLDAGCGVGTHLLPIIEGGGRGLGMDLSHASLLHARARVRTAPLTQGSVRALPYRSEAFDGVVCMGVLCYVPAADCAEALRELVRVTRPGGEIILHLKNLRSITGAGAGLKRMVRRLAGRHGLTMYFRTPGWYRRRLPPNVDVLGSWGWAALPLKSPALARADRWLLGRVPLLHAVSADLYLRLRVMSSAVPPERGR